MQLTGSEKPRFLYSGRVTPQRGWSMGAHLHESFAEFITVLSGKMEVTIRGRQHVAQAGEVLFYPAKEVHSERALGNQTFESIFFAWDPLTLDVSGWNTIASDPQGRIRSLVRWMLELRGEGAKHAPLLDALLLAVIHAYNDDGVRGSDEAIERARQFVWKNLPAPMTLADLAEAAGMSPFHFAHRFQKALGVSPMRFVRNARIETARSLILSSDLPLRVIAERAGFADQAQLSRVFRRQTGRVPSSLRSGS